MTITMNQREKDTLQKANEILNKYSIMFSAMVKGESGTFFDNAGSAAGMIESLLKEQEKQADFIPIPEVDFT